MERLERRFADLQESMEGMTREIHGLRREVKRRTLVVGVLAGALFASIVTVVLVQINNEQRLRESEARWCPMLSLLVPDQGATPTGKYGQDIARESTALAKSFQCEQN